MARCARGENGLLASMGGLLWMPWRAGFGHAGSNGAVQRRRSQDESLKAEALQLLYWPGKPRTGMQRKINGNRFNRQLLQTAAPEASPEAAKPAAPALAY